MDRDANLEAGLDVTAAVVLGGIVLLILIGAIANAESIVRVRGQRRCPDTRGEAERVARETGCEWEEAETRSREGLRLRGWLFQPSCWNGEAVVVLHGFTDSAKGMLAHAGMLLRKGYAVLTPDSRGHGRSEGDLVHFGLREADDFRLWGDWLCRRLGIYGFHVIGQSMGAAVVLQALSREMSRERRVRAVVAESPFYSFPEVALDRLAMRLRLPRRVLKPMLWAGIAYCRLRYQINLRQARPIDHLAGASRVLLIHGLADRSIPPRHSRVLHAAHRDRTELWEIAGIGHVEGLERKPQEYERRVIGFLDSVSRERAGNQPVDAARLG